jgi:hypothetical protein
MTPHRGSRALPDPNLEPTISVVRAGRILGMSRNSAYAAARDGRLPTVAISASRRVVVTAEFLERYRLRRVPVRPDTPQPPGVAGRPRPDVVRAVRVVPRRPA